MSSKPPSPSTIRSPTCTSTWGLPTVSPARTTWPWTSCWQPTPSTPPIPTSPPRSPLPMPMKASSARLSQYAEDAVKIDPTNPKMHGNLGIMYYRNSELDKAIPELALAVRGGTTADGDVVEGQPLDYGKIAEYYWFYGFALAKSNRCAEAVPVFQALLTGVPDDELAVENANAGLELCLVSHRDPCRRDHPHTLSYGTRSHRETTPFSPSKGELQYVPLHDPGGADHRRHVGIVGLPARRRCSRLSSPPPPPPARPTRISGRRRLTSSRASWTTPTRHRPPHPTRTPSTPTGAPCRPTPPTPWPGRRWRASRLIRSTCSAATPSAGRGSPKPWSRSIKPSSWTRMTAPCMPCAPSCWTGTPPTPPRPRCRPI